MDITTDIQFFGLLKEKLGEKETEALVEFVELKTKENNNANLKLLATKQDLALTNDKIALTNEKIALTNEKIVATKAELIKWMFIFWVGQVAVTFGFILLFLKK